MQATENTRISLGGESAFNWNFFGVAMPFFILGTPFIESNSLYGWVFWRWTLASVISALTLVILYALGDFYFFANRIKNPIPEWMLFLYGFIMGMSYGISMGAVTYFIRIQNDDLLMQIFQHGLSFGLSGMLLLPLSSLIISSINIYNTDREALIAERLLIESQKSESRAVIKSLRSSLSNKVDENLLRIIENSKDYFDTKNRSLEDNWELLAERLRRAALETIRPFSHSLHRSGDEITYRVKFHELLSYIAYKFDIHVFLTLFVYFVTANHSYINSDFQAEYLKILFIKIGILLVLLLLIKLLNKLSYFHKLGGFISIIAVNSILFVFITNQIIDALKLAKPELSVNITDGILIGILIVLISLGMAFLNGGHAEIEFLERRISEEQLETMLLRREEARISRELAKYLHGTIQSRLMASAIGLESAGRRGDLKALQREAKTAYKNLRLPSESYFSAPEKSLNEEINKVVTKWDNLMKIKVNLSAKLPDLADDLVQDLGNVINEGLANAFRHGNADKVNIRVNFRSNLLLLEIEDNGDGPTSGKGGLGSEWFDAIAGTDWELFNNSSHGCTLKLEIPIR